MKDKKKFGMSFHCKATDHISHISGPHRNVYINTEISEIRVMNLKRVIRIRTHVYGGRMDFDGRSNGLK